MSFLSNELAWIDKVKDFEGAPIPTSPVRAAVLAILAGTGHLGSAMCWE